MTPRRWLILVVAIPIYTFGMMVVSTIAARIMVIDELSLQEVRDGIHDIIKVFTEPWWWGWAGTIWGVAVALQIVFLLPIVRQRPPTGGRSHSLALSLCVAAIVAALMTFAFIATLMSGAMLLFDKTFDDSDLDWLLSIPFLSLLGGWLVWTAVFLVFVRGIWADRVLGRLIGVMIGGSILEILITIPIDIMVRRRTGCYCSEGTFFALIASIFALLWLAGPGIVIAVFAKRHRLWRETRCENCGYEKGPSPGERCPECGQTWSIKATPAQLDSSPSKREKKGG